MDSLKQLLMELVTHFNTETIIEVDIHTFDDKTIYESVKLLKEIFKNKYPKTKLKPMMKSIHYANGFKVEFFNKKNTEKSFVITPESLFKTHLESLLLSVNDH